MIEGIPAGFDYAEIGDRERAITSAIMGAGEDDTILIAGRGHEAVQDVAGRAIDIDDRVVARTALRLREGE